MHTVTQAQRVWSNPDVVQSYAMTDAKQTEESGSTNVREVKGWMNKSCIIPGRLDGKLAIVTGSNTGIGAITAGELARRGCRVIMACRNLERAQKAKDDILKKYGVDNPDSTKSDVADESVRASLKPINEDQLIIEKLDLGSLKSIREFAAKMCQTHPKIDLLINNAGLAPDNFAKTEDGFEQVMGVNHLGVFLLTELLLPIVKSAAPSRIVIVSSIGHRMGNIRKPDLFYPEEDFDPDRAYCNSKLANAMHARELSRRLEGSGVTVVSLHPGAVKTELLREATTMRRRIVTAITKPWFITPWQGAQTTMYTVLSNKLTSGGYYSNCALTQPAAAVNSDAECKWLWNKSMELVGLETATS